MTNHRTARSWTAALAGIALLGSTACTPVESASGPATAPSSPGFTEPSEIAPSAETLEPGSETPAASGEAIEALGTLEVKGRAPKTGYDRDEFGQAWADVDRNGCDTRNDILARDLTAVTIKPGTQDCVVLTVTLADPFTSTTIDFQRGQDTSSDVQVDHVVSLSDSWQKGAQQISAAEREAFSNDPLNLLAVDGPTNAAKGDGDAATWLPPNTAFRCDYVARQVAVKVKYELWVTAAEHDAIDRILDTCPDQQLPTDGTVRAELEPTEVVDPAPAPASEPTTSAPADVPAAPAGDDEAVDYANCSAVRAAGAEPIRTGDPGYEAHLDRDGDGIGCE